MSHLGPRVSALLDGQLPAEETERAWQHVHACHLCRDQVEREGWVKTQLAGWSLDEPRAGGAPDDLKAGLKSGLNGGPNGILSGNPFGMPPGDVYLAMAQTSGDAHPRRTRRAVGLVAIGGGAAGAAVMGVLALGTAPADAPSIDRRNPPVSQVFTPSPTPTKLAPTTRR